MAQATDRSMIMLNTALELEEKGKKYYDQAAKTTKNKFGREIWKILADYELEHIQKIREIYDSLKGGGAWSEELASMTVSKDIGSVLRKLTEKQKEHIKADTGDVEALDVGVDFESASIKFYEDHLAQAEDHLEKKFIKAMVAEERGHLNLLADLRYYYTDPESWFMEESRAGLDGV